jgi:hypothetical protein
MEIIYKRNKDTMQRGLGLERQKIKEMRKRFNLEMD